MTSTTTSPFPSHQISQDPLAGELNRQAVGR